MLHIHEEMGHFHEEMGHFHEEMGHFHEEMGHFHEEMRHFLLGIRVTGARLSEPQHVRTSYVTGKSHHASRSGEAAAGQETRAPMEE